MLIRYCARCRSEFQMQVMECLDCGGPTDVRDDEVPFEYPEVEFTRPPEEDEEEDGDEGKRPEPPPTPPKEELVVVRIATYGWIMDIADALAAREIQYWIADQGKNDRYGLFVRTENGEAAAAIDREVFLAGLREELPALPEERPGACPACGTDLPPGEVECPECGLNVAFSEEDVQRLLEKERGLEQDEDP